MAVRTRPTTGDLGWELGDYSILRTVDSGKFGIVYWAQHKPTGQQAALKLIPLEGADSDEKVAAERHGAMLQQRFSRTHKGMVPEIFEHQPIAMFYAIAMELVHGQPLTDVIAAGPLPARRAATIALAICRFLEAAHQFETEVEGVHYSLIVHGDLKPDHVLLLDNDEIRVLDFGIAKALAERTLVTTNKWGSIQYASPERLQSDGHVNEQADFWSLGVILFEMVAGFRPYRRYEHNASRLDAAIRRQETPEPLPPDADPVLVAIIRKMLAPQVERRYTSAAAHRPRSRGVSGRRTDTLAAADAAQASVATVRIAPDGTTPLRRTPQILPSAAIPADSGTGAQPVDSDRTAAARRPDNRGDRGDSAATAGGAGGRSVTCSVASFDAVLFVVLLSMAVQRVRRAGSRRPSAGADRRARRGGRAGDPTRGIRQHRRHGPASDWGRIAAGGAAARSDGRARRSGDSRVPQRSPCHHARCSGQQARDSLAFAQELAPRRSSITAKRAYIDGTSGPHRRRHRSRTGWKTRDRRISRSGAAGSAIARSVSRTRAHLRLLAVGRRRHSSRRSPRPNSAATHADAASARRLGDAYRLRAERARAAAAGSAVRSASNCSPRRRRLRPVHRAFRRAALLRFRQTTSGPAGGG